MVYIKPVYSPVEAKHSIRSLKATQCKTKLTLVKIDNYTTDESVLAELGQRIAQIRLSRNMTQQQVADEAGITRPTLTRIEKGLPTDFTSLIRLMRALKLMDRLDALIGEQTVSPIQLAGLKKNVRRRASGTKPEKREWQWGDE